jgi:uncharacterized protein (TIGR02145 family)
MIKSLGGDLKKLFIILSLLLSLSMGQDYSLSFDGMDDYVELSQTIDIGSSSFSISTWIQIPVVGNGNLEENERVGNILGTCCTNEDDFNLEIYENGELRLFWVHYGQGISEHGSKDLRDNLPHYITLNRDYENNLFQIYVDGYLDFEVTSSLAIELDRPFLIGKDYREGAGIPLHGMIDDLVIWNTPLTQEEIQSYMMTPPIGDEPGLAGYWSFNAGEGTTLYDYSDNGNNGTIHGGATWVENIYGCTDSFADNYNPDANWDDDSCEYPDNGDYSLHFDGVDDYVIGVASSVLDISNTNQLTLSAWVKPTASISAPRPPQVIFAHTSEGPQQQYALTINENGQMYFITAGANGSPGSFEDGINNTGNSILTLNHWNHISMTYDGFAIRLYLNGILDFEHFIVNNFQTTYIGNFYIGKSGSMASNYNGEIDDIHIWDTPLTQEQIQSYISIPPTGNEEGLVGYWNFNSGTGDVLYDHSGNGNHGTINGATWVENIYGCTDPCMDNYIPEANFDDGNCGEFVGCPENGDYSLSFDGVDDWIQINKPLLNPEAFSIVFNIQTGVNNKQLFWNGKNINSSSHLDNAFNFDLNTPDDFYTGFFSANNDESLWSYVSLTDNIIHEVVVTFENGTVKHFVDGLLTASDDFNFNSINIDDTNFTAIGRGIHTSGARYYDGLIREVLIINKSLDESELSNPLLNLNYPIDISAHYKFNSGSGDVLYDYSGNQNHGTIYGGATWIENIQGCTHPNATNYNDTANVDDGSCEYETVQIGHQVWMSENLKATHYRNGDVIDYADYDNDPANSEIYGRLYNWDTVNDERGICPENWSVASDDEWKNLELFLGLNEEFADNLGFRGSSIGSKLAANSDLWNDGNLENNLAFGLSGFNALPGGYIHLSGSSINLGNYASFLTSTGYGRDLANSEGGIDRWQMNVSNTGSYDNSSKHSIRCLSDELQTTTILVPENFATIQEAIDYSIDGDTILVSAGTYYENINFNGKNIAVIGEDRETTIIDGGGSGSVVKLNSGENSSSIFSNFTIINGSAGSGGGLYIENSNPIITNLDITNNNGISSGGGIFIQYSSSVLTDINIISNTSAKGAGICSDNSQAIFENINVLNNISSINGGGIDSYNSSDSINNSTISNNHSASNGGGVYSVNSNSSFDNVLIIGNYSEIHGGGGYFKSDSTLLNNVTVSDNTCVHDGGGFLFHGVDAELTSVLISDNQAKAGGGLAISENPDNTSEQSHIELYNVTIAYNTATQSNSGDGVLLKNNSNLNINNSIVWNVIEIEESNFSISYSCIQGGWEGEGNIDIDPQFRDPENDDYTLQSTSPCIDAGDPTSELDPDGTRADMGAYPFFQIPGCIDSLATNYDTEANINNGSCEYPDNGDYSLSFDGLGESVINISDLTIEPTDSITFSIDFKLDNYIHTSNHNIIFDLEGGNMRYTLLIGTDYMEMRFEGYSISFDFETSSLDNQWHNIIIQGTSYSMNIILDGNLMVSEIWTEPFVEHGLTPGDYGNFIGANDLQYGYYVKGQLDDFIISKNLLSFSNIQNSNFNNSLAAYYKFNAGEGDILYDHSGNGNHGTINGDATWQYEIPLNPGANLISFMSLPEDASVGNVLSPLDGIVTGIIGEGIAASPNPVLGWVGSLTEINPNLGYWLKVNQDVDFNVISENISDCDTVYSLNSGANLISYPCGYGVDINTAIPVSDDFDGIIGEGVAASSNSVLGWVGSLTDFEPNHGYWFKVDEDMDFQFQYGSDELSRRMFTQLDKDFNQSTQQAFYFIEDIENIEIGDIVSAYCNDTKVGSRAWNGAYTDIPAMGNDNSDLTKDYCTSNQVPTFRVEKPSGETYALTGDIPVWESNGLHILSSLQEAIILPESYSLAAAYPNPFNPTTTINFAIPADAQVSISVYNLQGREVVSLANGSYDAGYHSIIWNADTHSSGVYFVKMIAGSYVNTQKLMLVK